MVSQGANQMRLLLDTGERERAERVFSRQQRDVKMLTNLLAHIDRGVSALLKA
jgi:hypothetical protein